MKMMNHGRAAGPHGITIEALIALGEWGISQITDLLNMICDNGEIPEEICKSVFIMLPKKEGATECSLHRTISLMSHLTKLLLIIIMTRIRGKLRPEISNNQFGFVEDRGTRNAIFTLSMIIERAIEMKKDLYLCFIDYSKAFDRVRPDELYKILNRIDIDGKDLRVVRNLYWDQNAATRIDDEISEYKPIKRGVRQGCVLPPDFFKIYSEMILRNIYDLKGIRIGGVNINNLRYADDTVLMAESERRVQGKRDRRRQRVTFLHSLNQGVTQGTRSKTEFLRLADDIEEWRFMTADVCNRPGT
ncbi:endonuclease-reverse transcriptase [Elysia marginata]|uniref:Endonuclease-reverse transcriptase n=1 Tax=Elysia marginata TaxID=1093978 RepID=A0AAV4H2V8_9GAST|nr:endonuclease-reverse transcriptase [Elysia marginata]